MAKPNKQELEDQTLYYRILLARQIASLQVDLLNIGSDAYLWRHLKNLRKSRINITKTLDELIPLLEELQQLTEQDAHEDTN